MDARLDYKPIECGDYDFLEIACLQRYNVTLALKNGSISACAVNLATRADGEFLLLKDAQGTAVEVRLDQIVELTVTSRPARFQSHRFIGPVE